MTRLLVGVETIGQMKQNLQIASQGQLSSEIIKKIDSMIPSIRKELIDPVHWPTK